MSDVARNVVAGTDVVTENRTPATARKLQPIGIQVNPGKLRAMATEYILFDRTLCDRLVQFVAEHGRVADVRPDAIEGFVIVVPDTPDEDLESAIAAKYDSVVRPPVVHIARTTAVRCFSSASSAL